MNLDNILFALMWINGMWSVSSQHVSSKRPPQDVTKNTRKLYPCDYDLCSAGNRFCWHSMDGEDDRQCVPCSQLSQVCSQPDDWGKLTDCLVYKCLEPYLANYQARIIQLEERIQFLIITSGCLGVLVCLLLLLFAGYLIGKRLRRKTHGKDDTQSLISKDDSSGHSSASSTSVNMEDTTQPGNTAAGDEDRNEPAARNDTPEGPGQVDGSGDARKLCPGFNHIAPTASEGPNSAQMVPSSQAYNSED